MDNMILRHSILWLNVAHVLDNVMIKMVKLEIVEMKMLYAKMIYLVQMQMEIIAIL